MIRTSNATLSRRSAAIGARLRYMRGRVDLMARLGLWHAGLGGWPARGGLAGLAEIEQGIARALPDVHHITPEALAGRLASGDDVVVVDVREPEEIAVSRIPGSTPWLGTRVDAMTGDVVLVCAVGVRSALLASRLAGGRIDGAVRVANLSGGIFRWHGEGRPLVDDRGPTRAIHPYGRRWTRFVASPDQPGGG